MLPLSHRSVYVVSTLDYRWEDDTLMHVVWGAQLGTIANQRHCFLLIVLTLTYRWEEDTLIHGNWRGRFRTNTYTELVRFLDCSSYFGYRWEDDAQMPNECYLTRCGTIANRCLWTEGTIFLFLVLILEYGWENCTLMYVIWRAFTPLRTRFRFSRRNEWWQS